MEPNILSPARPLSSACPDWAAWAFSRAAMRWVGVSPAMLPRAAALFTPFRIVLMGNPLLIYGDALTARFPARWTGRISAC